MCPICERSTEPGWVCEDHPNQPWEHDGCRAAGVPCSCNPLRDLAWHKVFAELRREEPLQ